MQRAREKETRRHVYRQHIGPPHQFSGDLICWKCSAPFGAVREHTRLGSVVQAQYRLAAKTEHDDECPLNPTAVTEHIARGSQGLAEVDERGILRLNLPEKLGHVPPTTPGDAAPGQDVVRHTVTTVRPLLPPDISSAAKIARFLQLHDFDDEIVKRFKVRPYNGRLIEWGKFCYGPDGTSYADLFERCRSGGVFTHPVAVFGTVQRVNHDRQGRPYVMLALNVTADASRFHVAVRSDHAALVAPLTMGTQLLAVGGWEIFTGSFTPTLRLWTDDHWQIAYWNTDADGHPTMPQCPPPVLAAQRARSSQPRLRQPASAPPVPAQPSAQVSPAGPTAGSTQRHEDERAVPESPQAESDTPVQQQAGDDITSTRGAAGPLLPPLPAAPPLPPARAPEPALPTQTQEPASSPATAQGRLPAAVRRWLHRVRQR